jgi:hypothetical protein
MHAGALFLVVGFKSWFEFVLDCCLNKFRIGFEKKGGSKPFRAGRFWPSQQPSRA